jgi:hypothetical protein
VGELAFLPVWTDALFSEVSAETAFEFGLVEFGRVGASGKETEIVETAVVRVLVAFSGDFGYGIVVEMMFFGGEFEGRHGGRNGVDIIHYNCHTVYGHKY